MELVSENSSGMANPVIHVEVMGQRKKTRVRWDASNAFFDEVMYFNFTNLRKEQIQEAHVKITVYDAGWFFNSTIGVHNVRIICYPLPPFIFQSTNQ